MSPKKGLFQKERIVWYFFRGHVSFLRGNCFWGLCWYNCFCLHFFWDALVPQKQDSSDMLFESCCCFFRTIKRHVSKSPSFLENMISGHHPKHPQELLQDDLARTCCQNLKKMSENELTGKSHQPKL